MKETVVGIVTPHLLRVVDLAGQAEQGINVDWHLRGAVNGTLQDLRHQYNAEVLVQAYVEGLESAATQAPGNRAEYARALQVAAVLARSPR